MRATVTSKGQITIPAAIRRRLNLHPGAVLDFDEGAGFLKALKCVDRERVHTAIGLARKKLAGKSTQEWLDELRGPVELPARPSAR